MKQQFSIEQWLREKEYIIFDINGSVLSSKEEIEGFLLVGSVFFCLFVCFYAPCVDMLSFSPLSRDDFQDRVEMLDVFHAGWNVIQGDTSKRPRVQRTTDRMRTFSTNFLPIVYFNTFYTVTLLKLTQMTRSFQTHTHRPVYQF